MLSNRHFYDTFFSLYNSIFKKIVKNALAPIVEVRRIIKQNKKLKNVKIIFLSIRSDTNGISRYPQNDLKRMGTKTVHLGFLRVSVTFVK